MTGVSGGDSYINGEQRAVTSGIEIRHGRAGDLGCVRSFDSSSKDLCQVYFDGHASSGRDGFRCFTISDLGCVRGFDSSGKDLCQVTQ